MRSSSAIHQSAWPSRSTASSPASAARSSAVLAHRLQQAVLGLGVAVAVGVLVELHEALVDEPADQIQHGPLIEVAQRRAERLGQPEPEACREHTLEAAQHAALVVVEEVVAPLHRGQQRLLARQRACGRPPVEQPEPLAEIAGDRAPAAIAGIDAAASSIANGIPSSCWQIVHASRSICPASIRRSGRARRARSTNSLIGVERRERLDIDSDVPAPATTATAPAT